MNINTYVLPIHRSSQCLNIQLSNRYNYDWCGEVCSGVKLLVMEVETLDEETEKCSDFTDITLLNPVTGTQNIPLCTLSNLRIRDSKMEKK